MAIIESKLIESVYDLVDLRIIDWNRLNGYWDNELEAMETIANRFIGRATYSVIECDLYKVPYYRDRSELQWTHVGDSHWDLGYLYWNHFLFRDIGTIRFSDQPDFRGKFSFKDGSTAQFWGDIGVVSASTFAHTQRGFRPGDVWISVLDSKTQVVIESHVDLHDLLVDHLF